MSDRSERMGRSWGKSWGGTVEGDGTTGVRVMRLRAMRVKSYKVESGANKKRASKISLQSSLK